MKEDIEFSNFTGWHGTDERNIEGILENNFNETVGDEWLGEAVYFFTTGVGNPVIHAKNWVFTCPVDQRCARYVVIKVPVVVCKDTVLDLRTDDGLNLFNDFYKEVVAKIRQNKKRFSVEEKYEDGLTIRRMREKLDLEVVLSHMQVRFLDDRRERVHSRVNNCTFLCVFNPKDNINPGQLEIVEQGNVPNYP